jgi:hypothetical protein
MEKGTTCFESETFWRVRDSLLLTCEEPCAIGAALLSISIFQNPFIINIVDSALNPGQTAASLAETY